MLNPIISFLFLYNQLLQLKTHNCGHFSAVAKHSLSPLGSVTKSINFSQNKKTATKLKFATIFYTAPGVQ
ncbi:hypothetical protein UT300018_21450 [Clostridium faecium]